MYTNSRSTQNNKEEKYFKQHQQNTYDTYINKYAYFLHVHTKLYLYFCS